MPIFDAALNPPLSMLADLAAQLITSLDGSDLPAPQRSAVEWEEVLRARSEAMHRGDATMVDGQEALARMRAAVEPTSPSSEVALARLKVRQ
jgi:hypothetical protein